MIGTFQQAKKRAMRRASVLFSLTIGGPNSEKHPLFMLI